MMTATEASRNFSAMLDLVANGETVRITRGNQILADITPARPRTAADLRAAIDAADLPPLDDGLAADIESALETLKPSADPWQGRD